MSRSTSGEESTVTVTFQIKGENTLMTLVHSDLPDTDGGRGHEKGWNYFLDIFSEKFADAPRKKA
jgi:Activator of Hsp90 ATPase homolog 1-like protein